MQESLRRKVILSIALVLGLLIAGVLAIRLAILIRPAPEREEKPPAPLVVTAMELRRGDVTEKIRGYGIAEPIQRARIAAQVGGVVEEVPAHLRPGARVEKGTPLLTIQQADHVARLEKARARLAESREELTRAQGELEETRRKRALLESDIELAQAELRRAEDLLTQGALSESARDQARSALQGAQQRLSDNSRQERNLESSLARLDATVKASQSDVDLAQLDLDRTTPLAPFDGYIEERWVDPGDMVQPGRDLFTMVDRSRLELAVEIPAARAGAVRPGAPVELRTDATPPRVTTGTIDRVAPTILHRNRTLTVYILLDGGDALAPGTFLTAAVDGAQYPGVLAIPRSAILDGYIFLAVDGKARRLEPSFTAILDEVALTRDDLGEGSLLITSGFERLYDGAPVEVPRIDGAATEAAPPGNPG